MARPAVVVDEVLLPNLQGHRERVVQRDRVVRHLRDGVLVVHVEELEPRPAHERLPCLVGVALLQQLRPDLLADAVARGAIVGCVLGSLYVLGRLELLLDRAAD